MRKDTIGTVIVLSALTAGCQTDQQAAGKPSLAEIKQMILVDKERLFKDAPSIKGARIGTTALCIAFGDCVCLELNAKNSFGGYTGMTTETVVYSNGRVTDVRRPKDTEFCTIVEDFPELNGDYRAVPPTAPAASRRTKPGGT